MAILQLFFRRLHPFSTSSWRWQFVCTNYFVCLPFAVRQLQRTTATFATAILVLRLRLPLLLLLLVLLLLPLHSTLLRFLYFRYKHFRFALLQIYCFLAGFVPSRMRCVCPFCTCLLQALLEELFSALLESDGPSTFKTGSTSRRGHGLNQTVKWRQSGSAVTTSVPPIPPYAPLPLYSSGRKYAFSCMWNCYIFTIRQIYIYFYAFLISSSPKTWRWKIEMSFLINHFGKFGGLVCFGCRSPSPTVCAYFRFRWPWPGSEPRPGLAPGFFPPHFRGAFLGGLTFAGYFQRRHCSWHN